MTFQINGSSGKYDGIISNESVKYGRNAVENHTQYMEYPLVSDNNSTPPVFDFTPSQESDERNFKKLDKFIKDNDAYLKALPPLEYEYRYIPNFTDGNINKMALYGAAYELMGAKEISVKDFESRYLINDNFTAEPLDVNKDGKIDVAEYGANMLASDVLSKDSDDISSADGTINPKGMNAILAYSQKSRAEAAAKLYSNIYKTYDLGSELSEFNPNN